ncbi:MAG: O-antigen ligase family protein [Candidatus Eisenbacteria bacterium]|nr:O-antigen ligase family protein [Candidatus Eisenbacteria bacterium]
MSAARRAGAEAAGRRQSTWKGGAAPPRRAAWRRLADALRGDPATGTDWVTRLVGVALLVAFGILVGSQLLTPDKRTISVIVALVLFGIAWRMDIVSGLGVLMLALPFPRGTVFGSTNVVLVLLISVIWLLRVSLRRAAPPRGSLIDGPLLALLLAFVVSFYNVESKSVLLKAFENFGQLLACVALLYMVVNNVRTPQQLQRLHYYQAASIAIVGLLGVVELVNPTAVMIPGWIEFFHNPTSTAISTHNLRVGGPFTDFELFSEYAALNLLLLFILFVRARTAAAKVTFGALLGLMWLMMFATVTRGGIVALGLGLLYLGWLLRARLNVVRTVILAGGVIASFVIMNFSVSRLTKAGDLTARFLDPQSLAFKNGMPVARAPIWQQAWQRMMEHPIIGHGPVYTLERGLSYWYWPHNGYLFIGNLVGFVGLGFFLWMMARLWIISRPIVRDLDDPNYARAFLVIGHVQIFVFLVDQMKIDFMRNPIYPFQIWLMFASIAVARRLADAPAQAAAPARTR